ncbi:MAG: n-acetylglutamate synthase [Bacteroidota bacterium]
MLPISYNGRQFRTVSNSPNGEVSDATRFEYRQRGDVVWATYEGGGIRFGTLVASVDDDGVLDMRYAHVNTKGDMMTGTCRSTPEVLPDGRLRLHERWQWTSGDESAGTSVVEEIAP